MSKKNTFLQGAHRFIKANKLKSNNGFTKYVLLNFVKAINAVSKDFIFKGGNLIWLYTKTPRATIDLDFSTKNISSPEEVKKIINKAANKISNISYTIDSLSEVTRKKMKGAKVKIKYVTDEGASNKFEIDIVYLTPIAHQEILFIDNKSKIIAASMESIITDKIDACHRFKSGNTRIKDYDDLYRLSLKTKDLNSAVIHKFIENNSFQPILNKEWITKEMRNSWKKHLKIYNDLPTRLEQLFEVVNKNLLKKQ